MSETGQGLSIRAQKVRGIFSEFDSNRDGCLNRDEMAALVIAVNPRVKFSKDQIEAILDEVFRTYGEFIEGPKGLSFEGLLRTYDDGAGDVDRDFDALGLHLASASIAGDGNEELQTTETKINSRVDLGGSGSRLPTPSIADETSGNVVKRSSNVGAWARSPNHGITYDETWGLIEDLELHLKRYEAKQRKQRDEKKGGGLNGVDTAAAAADWEDGVDKGEGFDRRRQEDELGSESAAFKKSLAEFREKAGKVQTPDQAFDRHMAMGRCLLEHHWYEEAIKSFDLAERLKPQDVRAPFLMGNAYYSLGKYVDAEKKYRVALEAGEANSVQWQDLLPQVHVNLGIALEGEGMLIGACYHYREAAILNAKHYRALKLLGSALYGLGEYRAAEQCLVEALVLKPDYADAHCDLGSALHAQTDDDKAIQEFQKAIDLNPNHHDALYNLGGLLKDSGRDVCEGACIEARGMEGTIE
jgi:tetratricopeptide (TPR) repeat protein